MKFQVSEKLPRQFKAALVLLLDVLLCYFSVVAAFYMRLGDFISFFEAPVKVFAISLFLFFPVFLHFNAYREIFRYSGWLSLKKIFIATIIYAALFFTSLIVLKIPDVPRTVGLIQPLAFLTLVILSRSLIRSIFIDGFGLKPKGKSKTLIYGAGSAGYQISNAAKASDDFEIVGFLDDNSELHGHLLNGLKIYNPKDLCELVSTRKIEIVLLAMPSVSKQRRQKIFEEISSHPLSVRTLPSFSDLALGKASLSDIHEVVLDDLLGREVVPADQKLLLGTVTNKVVLVTGAGGSIGGELCRQIIRLKPLKVLLLEQNEFALYSISNELEQLNSDVEFLALLGSTVDEPYIKTIFDKYKPDTVFHSAAYKHVPIVERNIIPGIRNNVFGTLVMAEASIGSGVKNFVLISSDKAVRPTNVMGASKRLSEMILQGLADQKHEVIFSMVRFGNVLGSSGSVIPKFRQQIAKREAITLTHPDITRFFMTIEEAALLVIQSSSLSKGGDVFLLDMGAPVKIYELARRLVENSGLTVRNELCPEGDIPIKITGLRPGEKLYEELLIDSKSEPTEHDKIMRAIESAVDWDLLSVQLKKLQSLIDKNDSLAVHELLSELVVEYRRTSPIIDDLCSN